MKRLLAALLLWPGIVLANVPCTVPFNLQNGTTADASQVMANYNALITCLTNAAAAGTNSDITSLQGLTTPLGPTFGGTNHFIAGTAGGTSSAATVTVLPATFTTPQQGWQVSFTVATTNPGPMTLQVNSGPVVNVFRPTTIGPAAMAGGELIAGHRVTVEYDGTEWQWSAPPIQIGKVTDHAGACPPGLLTANNLAVSRTTFSALFFVIGTAWGAGDGSTTFNLPDLRGRAAYGQDQNVGGLANRITVAGGNFDGTVIGNAGGLQNHTQTIGELATHNHGITDPGHVHTLPTAVSAGAQAAMNISFAAIGTINSGLSTTGITVNNQGSGNPFTVLAPAAIVNKCVQP